MEGSHSQYLMCVKSHSHIEAPIGDDNKNYYSWEERAFAEDTARILGGSMWPPKSYSCTFCKREFRSAQALGGHMNIHRRDRARLKQSHNYETLHHHHKSYFIKSSLGNHHFSAPDISTQIDCGLNAYYPSPATTITTTRLSGISTQENCGQHSFSPSSSSSIVMAHLGSSNSKQEGVVKAREFNFNGLGYSNYVETSLSVGLTSMFGQKSSSTVPCGDRANISCKRLKTMIYSLPQKPCCNDKNLALQPQEIPLGVNHGMEDLDLELRLGKQQKV